MTPERYRQVKEIFGEVCGKPATERAAYLDEACAVDAGLRAEVESLLAHDGESLPVDLGISPAGVLGLDGSQADGTDGRRPRPDLGIGDELPERVGRYRIIRQIGEGGMGCVFEAEQDNPRRTVALKLIRPGVASAQTLRRFKLEAHVLGSLQHAGIAQIYEAGTAEVQRHDGSAIEQPFFAMELIHGEPLTEFVQHGGLGVGALAGASCSETCSLAQRLELLARVCDAIDHAHQRGVIHRDLKPGNILVDEHGQPKILDFGVARVTAADAPLTTLHTDVGQLIGTLAYMSPEQVSGDSKDVGTRSDVYALGVVLFQLLTDKLPYDVSAKTIPEAVRTIAEQEPTPLGTLNRVYRGELSTIVGKALEKDPARRYPSAAALAEDLRRYLSHQPIAAHPATTLYQLRKFARRNPALVGGVVVAFVCLLIGVVGTTSQAIRATHARNQALEAERVAEQRRTEAEEQRAEAERQAALAQAVNEFLRDDLLAVASPEKERDRNITVRAVLDRAAAGIGGRFQGQPLVEAAIRATLGESYYGLGEYALAEPQMSRALELRKAEIGEESPLTLAAMHTLAGLYSNQARYAEAEALFVRTLELRRRILGADHRATLATMSLLALLYGRVGRDAEAEPLLLDVIERAQRTLGAEDRTTLIAQANLADVYVRQRRLAEAEPLYQQVLEAERRAWGEEVPGTLATMNNLANLYALQKRFAEAEPLCVRTLEIRWRVMGETHPQTLSSLNSLAVLYKRQGRYAEAEPLFIQALEAKRRELGDEHPNTLVSLNNLANLYAVQGRHAEAEQLFLQALEVRRRVLGENHPQTLSTIGNLVELYRTQGRDEEAAEWCAKLPATQAAAAKDRGPEGE